MSLFEPIDKLALSTRKKIRKLIAFLLNNSDDYYSSFYPGTRSFIIEKILKHLVNKINIDHNSLEKIKNIAPGSIVVFACKNKHMFDFLYFHTLLKPMNGPYPELSFDLRFVFLLPVKQLGRIILSHLNHFFHYFHFKDIYVDGYARKMLLENRAGFISLIEEDEFYNRFIRSTPDPLFHLIELQKQTEKSVVIVPEDIIYITKPMHKNPSLGDILFGTHENPGRIKRIFTMLRQPDKIRVEVARPVNLKEFIARPEIQRLDSEFQTHRLRSQLVDILNRQRKSITGPVLKSRQEITEDILNRKSLREFLAAYADKTGAPLRKVNKKAAAYIDEIAANYSLRVINILNWLFTWVFKNIFEGVSVSQDEINTMRETYTKAPLILIPCHKSHLDYLLLPYVMFKNNMPCPHIAAGKNLAFWPLGPIFRGAGAFFLRRTFKGAELYTRIFAAYIEKLLYEGFNIKIYIEGGRSRTGKVLPPKTGGLSMIIRAFLSGACEDLYFVPIYVGYDRVLEEDAYIKEIEGGNKTPENLKGLLNTRKFLKRKYGKVYLKFDTPISMNAYMAEKGVDLKKSSDGEFSLFVRGFGYKLINAINDNTVATPHGIIASGILNCSESTFTKKQMFARVTTYMNHLIFHGAYLSDTLMIDPDNAFNSVIENFISRNFIELADEDEDDITDTTMLIVKHNKRPILDYYKNSVICFFVPAAYTAAAIIETDRFKFEVQDLVSRYQFLQKLFTDEFSFDEQISTYEQISKALKGFINEGILVPDIEFADTFNVTSEGLRKLKWFAAFLIPFFESYMTCLVFLEKEKTDKYDVKERSKKLLAFGTKLYKRNQVVRKESLSLINYRNAVNYFARHHINGSKDQTHIDQYKEIIDLLSRRISS
ncbi:1-acyl-sn-glycerol-3-phosphate acyltransferase [Desulfobacter latus]|uniref:Glycerol-3-phosphate acyltransferase n=1 Tax=Desulfobacter latus TaxID=2292 RepID=A0A850TAT0_9BACT|nr:1-acyl-sn-glycerol-3-phosphate acyltransferase [Desulfobacter latus]NWH05708.1 1-acyl-sn-glycerol-3-phosphate acyltransferase [Desulfobacter latus]